MSRRPSSLFRGSELPRLLFLAAIVLAGWPMVVLFARPGAEEKPPRTPLRADALTPVVPDDSPEFQALVDKTPIQLRESGAYAKLLERARDTPADRLAASARKDILYTHLWERPERYRGVPIHIEGTARRIITYEANPSLVPNGRLFEAWVYSDENRAFPYVLVFEEPPPGLPIEAEVFLRVTFDGYFMKLLRYQAGDNVRGAPLLVGRLRIAPAPAEAPAPMVELRAYSRRDGFVLVFVLLLIYVAIRALFMVRKALAPSRPRIPPTPPREGLPPDQVVDWLRNLPDEEEQDPEVAKSIPRDHPDH